MKKLKVLLSFFILVTQLFLLSDLYSKDLLVTGTVTNASTNNPLTGVKVTVKGTGIITFTDLYGRYSIIVPEQSELEFTSDRFSTLVMQVPDGNTLSVKMKPVPLNAYPEMPFTDSGRLQISQITSDFNMPVLKPGPGNKMQYMEIDTTNKYYIRNPMHYHARKIPHQENK